MMMLESEAKRCELLRDIGLTTGVTAKLHRLLLPHHHFLIDSSFRHQFSVRALFDNASFVQHKNDIRVGDSGKAMSNNKGGSSPEEFMYRLLNQLFAFRIKTAGSFIQDQDMWIRQDGSSDRKPLSLSAGEFDASFSNDRIVTIF